MIAMDCTIANGHPSKKDSLHFMPTIDDSDDDAELGGNASQAK